MKSKSNVIILIVISCLLVSGIILFLCQGKEKKAVYILTERVFNEYAGTKEVAQKLKLVEKQQKLTLDSIYLQMSVEEKKGKVGEAAYQRNKDLYAKIYSDFSNKNQNQSQQYKEVLWNQINKYVADYGKTKDYAYIYGATGSGNIMYADTTLNVTEDVVKFINKKYAGE